MNTNKITMRYNGGLIQGLVDGTQRYFDLGHNYVHNKTATNNLILDYTGGLIKGYVGSTQVYFDLGHNYIHNKTNTNNLLLDLSGDLIKGYSGSTQKYFDLGTTYIKNNTSAKDLRLGISSGNLIQAFQGTAQRYFDNGNIYTFNDTSGKKVSFKYDSTENTLKAYVDGTEVMFSGGNKGIAVIKEWHSGENFYRIFSDGWCEQGGFVKYTGVEKIPVTYWIPYKDNSYHIYVDKYFSDGCESMASGHGIRGKKEIINSPSGTYIYLCSDHGISATWKTEGFINLSDVP